MPCSVSVALSKSPGSAKRSTKVRREHAGIDLVLRGGRCRARPHRRYDHRQHAHHQGAAQSNVHVPLTSPFLFCLCCVGMVLRGVPHVGAVKHIPTTTPSSPYLSVGGDRRQPVALLASHAPRCPPSAGRGSGPLPTLRRHLTKIVR